MEEPLYNNLLPEYVGGFPDEPVLPIFTDVPSTSATIYAEAGSDQSQW